MSKGNGNGLRNIMIVLGFMVSILLGWMVSMNGNINALENKQQTLSTGVAADIAEIRTDVRWIKERLGQKP